MKTEVNQQPFRVAPDGARCCHLSNQGMPAQRKPQQVKIFGVTAARIWHKQLLSPSVISALAPFLNSIWVYSLKALSFESEAHTDPAEGEEEQRGQQQRGQRSKFPSIRLLSGNLSSHLVSLFHLNLNQRGCQLKCFAQG